MTQAGLSALCREPSLFGTIRLGDLMIFNFRDLEKEGPSGAAGSDDPKSSVCSTFKMVSSTRTVGWGIQKSCLGRPS